MAHRTARLNRVLRELRGPMEKILSGEHEVLIIQTGGNGHDPYVTVCPEGYKLRRKPNPRARK